MANTLHTLLEQTISISNNAKLVGFFTSVMGFAVHTNIFKPNDNGYINFIMSDANVAPSSVVFEFIPKNNIGINPVPKSDVVGSIFGHVSAQETVKYFKYELVGGDTYTYIVAQDENGEWIVFNGDKMYSDYGATGIYNNSQVGRSEIVDSGNQFMISKAHRFDTGVAFKELHFVLSAKSYSDTNCIVNFDGKLYRLVSVSNTKDEAGRYPAFAFPVSD